MQLRLTVSDDKHVFFKKKYYLTPWLPIRFQPKTSSLHGNTSSTVGARELFKSSKDSSSLQ